MSTLSRKWIRALLVVLAALSICLAILPGSSLHAIFHPLSFTKSVNRNSYFYRLHANYLHGSETVSFDIVVGCSVRVTRYQDNSSSYDAARDPIFMVQATKDGAAVMQIVPDACRGQTSENGRVPSDFMPGAVWFDRKEDLSFGIAYVTDDAFDSPKSKLKFLGATIVRATKEEWEAYRPTVTCH